MVGDEASDQVACAQVAIEHVRVAVADGDEAALDGLCEGAGYPGPVVGVAVEEHWSVNLLGGDDCGRVVGGIGIVDLPV